MADKRMSDEEFKCHFCPRTLVNKGSVTYLLTEAKRAREAEKQAVMRVQVLSGIREKLEAENATLKAEIDKYKKSAYYNRQLNG